MTPMDFSTENLELPENKMFCLIDSNKGVYIPQQFAKIWGDVSTMTSEQKIALSYGPEDLYYWEVWDEVVNKVEFLFDGQLCTLYENGDLFAVPIK